MKDLPQEEDVSESTTTDTTLKQDAEPQPFCTMFCHEIVQMRWKVLIFECIMTFGSYYIFDFPGCIGTGPGNTIQAQFYTSGQKYTQEMNQALYSVYSWPNTVLALFGGILIDSILGLRMATILFAVCVTLGGGLFWIGVVWNNYPLMLISRIVFGLGGESLSVSQSAYVARWFKGHRGLALAFGITLAFARVGSSFNFAFSPKIAEHWDVNTAAFVGFLTCIFSFICVLALTWFDKSAQKRGILPPETRETGGPMSLKKFFNLPVLMWIICAITVTSYMAILPFIGIAKNLFQVKYDLSDHTASLYVSLYQFTSAGGSPVTGALVDYSGGFTYWIILACLMFALVHFFLLATRIPAYLIMVSMGVAYSIIVSALWPVVPFTIDESMIGFAYGAMTAIQNLGVATFPLITGAILDHYTPPENTTNVTLAPFETPAPKLPQWKGFQLTELCFIGMSLIGTLFAILLWILDIKKNHGAISSSPKNRDALLSERKHLLNENKEEESA